MTFSKTPAELPAPRPEGAVNVADENMNLDDEPVRGEDSTFAALLSEVARAPALVPGRTLGRGERAGEHVILEAIGSGAFGTVYRAVHPVLGGEAAIKVLNSVHASDPSITQRFIEEARSIHRIRHPNIVALFGFGELPSGQLYYAMELLAGQTLSAALQHGPLEPALALVVLRQIAEGLDAAHAQGVLHRDLKPDNIFVVGELGPDCKVKLLDFGIAKLLDSSDLRTRTGMVLGTPGYMSPEQCAGEVIDTKSDIYALGVIAYELLTGERVFSAGGAREIMARHMFEAPLRPSLARSGLPVALDAPLLQMLEKQPARRPATAADAVRALSNALAVRAAGAKSAAINGHSLGWFLVISLGLAGALWAMESANLLGSRAEKQPEAVQLRPAAAAPTDDGAGPGVRAAPPSAQNGAGETTHGQPAAGPKSPKGRSTDRAARAPGERPAQLPKRTRRELEF